jgi:NADPH:quinone reductase-like Zn-dependent oxidoreductase
MKAVIFEKQGLEYLKIKEDVEQPTITDHDILFKVRAAAVNPFDYFTVSNAGGINPTTYSRFYLNWI